MKLFFDSNIALTNKTQNEPEKTVQQFNLSKPNNKTHNLTLNREKPYISSTLEKARLKHPPGRFLLGPIFHAGKTPYPEQRGSSA